MVVDTMPAELREAMSARCRMPREIEIEMLHWIPARRQMGVLGVRRTYLLDAARWPAGGVRLNCAVPYCTVTAAPQEDSEEQAPGCVRRAQRCRQGAAREWDGEWDGRGRDGMDSVGGGGGAPPD